ncbi:MAG: carboxypeptidase-like regulatory domain-containing protein [Acidobacteriia bacterium]|nr:carboxypeptidase-like regulatory domain-containing protein [Terriglobia bacterium]
MLKKRIRQIGHGLLCAAFACGLLSGQMTVTGTISGTVVDPSGQVIAGARITLTSVRTSDTRTGLANEVGVFNLVAVQPDTYNLRVEQRGFKAYERRGVVISANERVATGNIVLEIGEVTETISVVGEASQVQTDSSEHSAVITTSQVTNLTARGRDVVSMLRTIPGVQYQADQDSVGGSYGTGTPNIAGAFSGTNILAVDGVVSNDMGTPNVFSSVTTLDAIGEVKILLNSYQAEYAGNGGAVMQVVTKSGGKDFHGGGYTFVRNEALNANDFFNIRNNVNNGKRPRYRYRTLGASLGGPIYIPGHWNQDKSKMFGFYNVEDVRISVPNSNSASQYTMPTALERQGDFSQTLDVSGKLIPITDPTTGLQFPGNVIPQSRLNPNGLALMNILPLPNFNNRAISGGNYNYQIQEVQKWPKRSQLLKLDWVPTDKDRFFVRGKTWIAQQEGYAVAGGASPVGFFAQCYCFTEEGLGFGNTHVFSPTVVMEINTGVRHNREAWHPYGDNEINKVLRSAIGYNLSQWYPQANVSGYIPRYSFGGVPSAPNVSYDNRLLTGGTDFTFNFNDNITITRGTHTIKFGGDIYRIREYEGEQSTFSGTFDFGKQVLNPLDTNYAFSNAALGVFNSYTESNARYGANMRESLVEWFAQDSWKISKRLNIDYGIRWTWAGEMYPHNPGQQSVFMRSLYNASQAPPLYVPVTQNGVKYAQNPLTGALLPSPYVGLFVPGVGNPAPGGATSGDTNVPTGFVNQPGVLWGPRIGFAYDVFGDRRKLKTAIRGGAAILYNPRLSKWSNMVNNPPAIFTPITYYGDMRTFIQTAGTLSPSNTQGFNINNKTPDNYNITFGMQQDVGNSIVVDASYAGVFGQHIPQTLQINTVPYGTHFLPQYSGLTDNFFRPFPGYNNVAWTDNAYNSNYHALLLTINRRFANNLQFGFTYTFSKFMDYTGIPIYRPLRTWSYGFDGSDQTHNASLNLTYALPRASTMVHDNKIVKFVLDEWMLSGIAQWVSGTPAAIGFSTVQGTDLTGGGDGQRVNIVGNPNSTGSTFYSWFNTAAFAVPGKGDPGNAGKYSVRNPGVNNVDLALSKRFPLKNESRYFQFRWEAYNAFNHTQYSGINTAARFDLTTGAQVNALFGQVTSTRTPRVVQGSLRFTF